MTACALWFIADTKQDWAKEAVRDPQLAQELEIEVLPARPFDCRRALTAYVRFTLAQLFPEQAAQQVANHLVNRSRSTASRFRHRHRKNTKVQT